MAQPNLESAGAATLEFVAALVEALKQKTEAYEDALLSGLWEELWNLEELLEDSQR